MTKLGDDGYQGIVARASQDALASISSDLLHSGGGPAAYVLPIPDHDRETARATKSMDTKLSDLVDAMNQTIRINQQAQEAAARSERFSRRMSVASLWVSIASLAAAVGSIVVAVVALLSQR